MNHKIRRCLISLLLAVPCTASCITSAGGRGSSSHDSTPSPPTRQQPPLQTPRAEAATVSFEREIAEAPTPFEEGSFINEQHAWVAGSLKRTTDGGRTWEQMRPSAKSVEVFGKVEETFVRPYFVTPTRGWLKAGSGIWQTEDGGQTWQQIFSQGSVPQFADEQHGWIKTFVGELSQQSYVTQDGGRTWRPCGPVFDLNQQHPGGTVYFLTPNLGWAITARIIDRQSIYGVARTLDGGCNWQQLWTSDDDPDERYSDIYFLNEHEGWLAGKANGSLYYTADGGKSWEDVSLPTENIKVVSVHYTTSRVGWIIAKRMTSKDVEGMFYTTDGGKTWRKLSMDQIINGFSLGGKHNEIPAKWKDGRLFQMLCSSRARNQVN